LKNFEFAVYVNVYFIPGLAADHTVFKYIALPPGYTACYVKWINPLANESLPDYACRLAEQIDTQKPFVVVGLSFGGMLAVEIAKRFKPVCTILISSIPSIQHLPYYYRAAGHLRLHKVIPISFIQHAAILKRLFTTESSEDKRILKTMIRKSDIRFIRWALHAVLSWKNTDIPEKLFQIHGTRDGILPHRFTKPTYFINGGHLLILTRAKEINQILGSLLMP
jgi:pimeloyl-ACP methyl ester carboxylesterase